MKLNRIVTKLEFVIALHGQQAPKDMPDVAKSVSIVTTLKLP